MTDVQFKVLFQTQRRIYKNFAKRVIVANPILFVTLPILLIVLIYLQFIIHDRITHFVKSDINHDKILFLWGLLFFVAVLIGVSFFLYTIDSDRKVYEFILLLKENEVQQFKIYSNLPTLMIILIGLLAGLFSGFLSGLLVNLHSWYQIFVIIPFFIFMLLTLSQGFIVGGIIAYLLHNSWKMVLSKNNWKFCSSLSFLTVFMLTFIIYALSIILNFNIYLLTPFHFYTFGIIELISNNIFLSVLFFFLGIAQYFFLARVFKAILSYNITVPYKAQKSRNFIPSFFKKRQEKLTFSIITLELRNFTRTPDFFSNLALVAFLIFVTLSLGIYESINPPTRSDLNVVLFLSIPLFFGGIGLTIKFIDIGLNYIVNLAPIFSNPLLFAEIFHNLRF